MLGCKIDPEYKNNFVRKDGCTMCRLVTDMVDTGISLTEKISLFQTE